MLEPFVPRNVGSADSFAGPEDLVHDIRSEPVDPGLHEPRRHGRTTADYILERGDIAGSAFGFGKSHDAKHHGGHQRDAIDPVAFNEFKEGRRLKARHQDHFRSTEEGLEARTEGGRMVEGPRHQR